MNITEWLTLDELATYLKISRAKLYQMSQNVEIPASKVGSQWRFNQVEIDMWLKNQRPHNATNQPEETSKVTEE